VAESCDCSTAFFTGKRRLSTIRSASLGETYRAADRIFARRTGVREEGSGFSRQGGARLRGFLGVFAGVFFALAAEEVKAFLREALIESLESRDELRVRLIVPLPFVAVL
jgi:hypothetical protein